MLRAEEAAGLDLVHHAKHDIYHAKVVDPLRIDKLYNAGILNKRQHSNGLKLFIVHTLVEKKFIRCLSYDDPTFRGMDLHSRNAIEENEVLRLSAQDILYSVMAFLRKAGEHHYDIIYRVCLKEEAYTMVTRSLKIQPRKAHKYLINAFAVLSSALEEVKDKQTVIKKLFDTE